MMEPVPSLVPGSQAIRLEDDAVVVRTWHRTLRMRGAAADLALRVMEATDGKAGVTDIANRLHADPAAVEKILVKLRDVGVVQWGLDPATTTSQHHTLDLASGAPQPGGLLGDEREARLLVVGQGLASRLVAQRVRELGQETVTCVASPDELPDDELGGCVVFAEELMTYRDALTMDSRAAAGAAWCAGWWEGAQLVVTHEMRFGRSACFECLLERQRANYLQPDVDTALEERLRSGATTTAGLDRTDAVPTVLSTLLADLLSLRARAMLSRGTASNRPHQLAEFDLVTWDLRWSTVLRLPSCRRCSPGVIRPPRAMA
jgi:hypothetical protein